MSAIPTAQGLYRLQWKRRDKDIWKAEDWALIYVGTWRWYALGSGIFIHPQAFEAKLAAYWMWEIADLTWDGAIAFLENKESRVKYRHAARANALILDVESIAGDRLSVDQKIAIAQVRAQMATIEKIGLQTEQLRIANLIAVGSRFAPDEPIDLASDREFDEYEAAYATYQTYQETIDVEIKHGLGIR